MVDSFEMQKRYFTAQLELYRTKPELNRAKIEDCEHNLSVLEEAGSAAAFMKIVKETGNMVSTTKAESIDMYENRAFIFEKLGEKKKAEEDRLRLALTESAENHMELSEKLEKFETETKLSYNENKALTAVSSVISAVFQLATDGRGSADESRSRTNAVSAWKLMREADPEASWEKITTYPPYRDRMIFTDSQLPVLEKIFREVCHG